MFAGETPVNILCFLLWQEKICREDWGKIENRALVKHKRNWNPSKWV